MRELRTHLPAAAAAALALVLLWVAFGATASEIARFLAYEAGLVVAPGVLAYRVLSGRRGGALRHLAIGWPLGYAIELASFMVTAALDVRILMPALPIAVALAAAWYLRRTPGAPADSGAEPGAEEPEAPPAPAISRAGGWALAAIAVLALGYLATGFYTETPLPRDTDSVAYDADLVFHVELVAEAKHHWPIEQPSVTDTSLPYHLYAHMHMGAVSQTTGIDPATLVFRFFPAALMLLVVLQLAALGRNLTRAAWGAPLAAGLVLLVGELDLDPGRPSPFADTFFEALPLSPTYFFGIPLFVAAATVLLDYLSRPSSPRRAEWLLLGALLAAGAGAKASVVPVLAGGLVLWAAWAWIRRTGWPMGRAMISLGIAVAVMAVTYALLLSGSGGGGVSLELFQFTEFTVIEELVDPASHSALGDIALTGVTGILGGAALVLPALGILWVLRERGLSLRPAEAWLLALFVTALGAFAVFGHIALSQAYFLNYGYIAGCVLGAQGMLLAIDRVCAGDRDRLIRLAALAIAAVAVVAFVALLVDPFPETLSLSQLGLIYGVAALVVVALAIVGHRVLGLTGAGVVGLAAMLTIALGLLNTPFDAGVPVARKLDADQKLHASDTPPVRGMTDELYEGLLWVRDNSGSDDVIAVNNHWVDDPELISSYFYYTAFAERRAFLESWRYTYESAEIGLESVDSGEELPYPGLRALNDAVFLRGDQEAVGTLEADYGVDYLLVDRLHGSVSPRLRLLGPPLYENEALTVYGVS